ncbi:MAG: hypothetical protein GW845_09485, partial [Rhodoferax sp.]|nr:hypothetical protein [Rhodoferax sp.]
MKSELKEFVTKYLAIVGGTFLAVSFVAFVSIPYTLGNASGGLSMDKLSSLATTTSSS